MTVVGGPQEGDGREGLVTSIQALLALFYADNGLVASPESARLQGEFNALGGGGGGEKVELGTGHHRSIGCSFLPSLPG